MYSTTFLYTNTSQFQRMGEPPPAPPDWLSIRSNEEVWVRTAPSGNLVLGSLTIGFVLLLTTSIAIGFFTSVVTGRTLSIAVLSVILALLAATYLVINRREYVLTSQRVCVGVGLLSKDVRTVALDDVHDVSVDRSGWRGWLAVGNLRFLTTDGTEIRFSFVDNPQVAYERALDSIESTDVSLV